MPPTYPATSFLPGSLILSPEIFWKLIALVHSGEAQRLLGVGMTTSCPLVPDAVYPLPHVLPLVSGSEDSRHGADAELGSLDWQFSDCAILSLIRYFSTLKWLHQKLFSSERNESTSSIPSSAIFISSFHIPPILNIPSFKKGAECKQQQNQHVSAHKALANSAFLPELLTNSVKSGFSRGF